MFVILFCFILSNYVAYYYLNALSGWGSISTEVNNLFRRILCSVSMPSRAGTPFLHIYGNCYFSNSIILYQCPFGLKLHFYLDEEVKVIVPIWYQCPFGLKLHFYRMHQKVKQGNWQKYQCPFGLKLHFYGDKQ